jgi:hypothetical protein
MGISEIRFPEVDRSARGQEINHGDDHRDDAGRQAVR